MPRRALPAAPPPPIHWILPDRGSVQMSLAVRQSGLFVQKQQDVNFQLIQPVLYGSSLKPRCMVLFVVLYVAQYGQQLHHSFERHK